MLWKRYSDFSRLSLKNVPLDLQKINVEIHISTFTLLLASFSGKLSHQQLTGGFSLETKPSAKQKKTVQNIYSLFGLERKMRHGVGVSSWELCWKHSREAGDSWYQRAGLALKIWVLPSALTFLMGVICFQPLFLLCTLVHRPTLHVCREHACTHTAPGRVTGSFGSQVPRTWVHPSLQVKQDLTGGKRSLSTPDAKLRAFHFAGSGPNSLFFREH